MMGKYDFKVCEKPDGVFGGYAKVARDFDKSGDECWCNRYSTTKDSANAAAALQQAIKKHGYPIKAVKNGLAVYLIRE